MYPATQDLALLLGIVPFDLRVAEVLVAGHDPPRRTLADPLGSLEDQHIVKFATPLANSPCSREEGFATKGSVELGIVGSEIINKPSVEPSHTIPSQRRKIVRDWIKRIAFAFS